MRTDTILSNGKVAVMAEYSKSERESLVYHPQVEVPSTLSLYLSAMSGTPPVHVVNAKEVYFNFGATGTFTSISVDDLHFQPLVPIMSILTDKFFVPRSVCDIRGFLLFLMGLIIQSSVCSFLLGRFEYRLAPCHKQSPIQRLDIG